MSEDALRWVEVASADELWEGDLLGVEVAGEEVLLVALAGGEVRAYQGTCPHQEQKLAEGDLDEHVLTCPGHMWEFDMRTGEGINPRGCQLYAYQVRRQGDSILVGVPVAAGRRHNRCTAA